MKAVVLVGGEGTRLRPLTYSTPKPLLPIANQAFLERQLSWLAHHGVDEVVLSLGYLPDAFEAHFPEGRFGDVKLRYAVEDHPLGTAGAIRFATRGMDERIVVCNGDVLTTLDLDALVAFHDERGAEATIHLTRVEDPSAFGVVPTRDDGEVVAFVEKPPKGVAPTNWINAGTYVLEPSVLDRIPERLTVSIERETFPRMLDEPSRLYAMSSDAYWIDIGTPEKYLQAHRDVLSAVLGGAPAPGRASARPACGCRVRPTSTPTRGSRPPRWSATVPWWGSEPGSWGRSSAKRASWPTARRVLRSVVHARGRLERDAEAIDSVVGAGAVLGAGAIASDHTVMGAGAELGAGARASGARVRRAEPEVPDEG